MVVEDQDKKETTMGHLKDAVMIVVMIVLVLAEVEEEGTLVEIEIWVAVEEAHLVDKEITFLVIDVLETSMKTHKNSCQSRQVAVVTEEDGIQLAEDVEEEEEEMSQTVVTNEHDMTKDTKLNNMVTMLLDTTMKAMGMMKDIIPTHHNKVVVVVEDALHVEEVEEEEQLVDMVLQVNTQLQMVVQKQSIILKTLLIIHHQWSKQLTILDVVDMATLM